MEYFSLYLHLFIVAMGLWCDLTSILKYDFLYIVMPKVCSADFVEASCVHVKNVKLQQPIFHSCRPLFERDITQSGKY